jgi:serine/threonine protein kinase
MLPQNDPNKPKVVKPAAPPPAVNPASDAITKQILPHDVKYQMDKELGRGGMGVVLSVLDKNIQRKVAMKVIIPKQATRPDQIIRFIEEVQITGQLEHPNIVPTYELGTTRDGKIYYTMKLVKGKTLSDIIEENQKKKASRPYSLTRLLQIFIQVCNGIAFAHSKKAIHRDLKPENIMVGEFGEVMIMDWGLAKVLGQPEHIGPHTTETVKGIKETDISSRTLDGMVMGTPSYMPPEQAAGRISDLDERSDIYSLGAILYEILTYAPPYTGNDVRKILGDVVKKPVILPRLRNPSNNIPAELEAICLKAMAKQQASRYGSAQELAADIQNYLEGRSVAARPDSLPTRAVKWVRRNKILSGGIAAVILASAGIYFGLTYYQRSKIRDEIYVNLAQADEFESDKDYAKALESYNKVLGLDPLNVTAQDGAEKCKTKLSAAAESGKKQAVESEREKRISEFLKLARKSKEEGDRLLTTEVKPVEDELFNPESFKEIAKTNERFSSYHNKWLYNCRTAKTKYENAVRNYLSVCQIEPENETANKNLLDINKIYFDWAEKGNNSELADIYEQSLRFYDRKGRYKDYLKGDGRLKITSNPPNAEVYIFRFETTADGRLAPAGCDTVESTIQNLANLQSQKVGKTPTDWVTLEMGSYLVILRKEGYADTRYPVYIGRQESETADVKLYKSSEIPQGMVYVPAGEFFPTLALNIQVNLPGFFIGKYELTNADFDDKPSDNLTSAQYVTVFMVEKYAQRKAGGRYRPPSVDEWLKAARGADKRLYPWGNTANPNFANVSRGSEATAPKPGGRFPLDCSVYGVYDMAGNLSEWTTEFRVTGGEKYFVIKGGRINWAIANSTIDAVQFYKGDFRTFEVGARVVMGTE